MHVHSKHRVLAYCHIKKTGPCAAFHLLCSAAWGVHMHSLVTVSHLSLLCREQMALWRHRDDEQPVAGNISCGLTPGQPQRAVTQLAHLQIFRSYYLLHHYSTQDKTELAIH